MYGPGGGYLQCSVYLSQSLTRKERRNGPAWQEGGSVLTVGEKCPRSLGDLLGNAEGNRDMQGNAHIICMGDSGHSPQDEKSLKNNCQPVGNKSC